MEHVSEEVGWVDVLRINFPMGWQFFVEKAQKKTTCGQEEQDDSFQKWDSFCVFFQALKEFDSIWLRSC